ncbi:ATP synthase F1, gamma subunit [Ammonifex degensii KC4]|uniref:ATP synthase gamma chain n=1 Tax=Ammonifex degensii (strain DSM 10501 / KC4) TaxID=429009 RepID=C9RAE9_AMMDK|nr:ATP synthase F1 subunit gamma [Ammonifex degensii]ACX51258.1 ATP synthase F1, gamma subunit [Ammonifex degensii KC4]
MPSLRDYRRRIKSLQSTRKICQAMKAVATAKMAKAQAALLAARPYSRHLREVLARLARAAGDVRHPLLAVREPRKVCYVVMTADRGLCGGFNSNLLRLAMREISACPGEVALIAVGRKGRNFFRFRRMAMDAEFTGLGEEIRFAYAREIAKVIINKYSAGEYDAVYLIYPQFINILVQRPTVQKVLPIEPPTEEPKAKGPEPLYIFEPSAEGVLCDLLPKYVETAIFHALLELKAGEHSARMTAMDAATKNTEDLIARLTLKMNRVRQESITKELLDIVGGAAALES